MTICPRKYNFVDLEINLDFVIWGGLLHDIGKTNDLNDFIENRNRAEQKSTIL